MKPDDAATANDQQKAGAIEMHQGIGSVAAEERECIPSELSGALSPALGRNNKSVAVVDELTGR